MILFKIFIQVQYKAYISIGISINIKVSVLVIFLRNPRGLGRQVIIDVAVTGVDGQSRATDEAVERPLQVSYDQKMAKYGPVAEQNNLRFVPAVFSHTGQIHGEFKALVIS